MMKGVVLFIIHHSRFRIEIMPTELSGVRKSAILLLTLNEDVAAEILKRLPPAAVEEISREIASRPQATQETRRDIFGEFYNLAIGDSAVNEGGLDYAKALLKKSLSEEDAKRVINTVTQQVQTTPFSFLQKAESDNLLTFIQDEHPQTIALILAHLPPQKASEILVGLPSQKQIEVVKRVATMEQTSPEVIKEVERGLEHRLSDIVSQTFEKAGGVDTVAEMLNLADRSTEKGIMEGLEAEDPDLVEQIRRLMFVFEDILLVNDKGIQSVLKEVDNSELALALKTASQELKDKIFKNMSERAAQLIGEDMQYMGPVRVSDVEAAQQKIVDIVRRLEDSGEIVIAGRGGEKEMIV
jgi:flagellar motor switch protein FliG